MPRPSRPKLPAIVGLLAALLTSSLTVQAGDILRGGAPSGSRPPTAAQSAGAAEAARARANAKDALSRTSQALQSVQQMQVNARKLAEGRSNAGADPNHPGQQLPSVPNGLVVGGLEVAPGVALNSPLWRGATLPRQNQVGGQTEVTIQQTAPQAVLNWKTFNVGSKTTVAFDQSNGGSQQGQWIAFNKVNDPSGVPSQILGQIKAPGQVYIINPNGIIFGGGSQINLRSLVASSLPINDNLVQQGLLNNRDAQFLFSSLSVPGGSDGTPAFNPIAPPTPTGRPGDVVVQAGAQLNSEAGGDGNGGRVMLVGPNVRNEGTISTPAGQTILAAGLQVGVAAHASTDPSLRGLDVWVGNVADYAGGSTNTGLIETPTGSVTMIGRAVNQLGVIESSSSVSLNGRIDLLASYGAVGNPNFNVTNTAAFAFQQTGSVSFGESSATRILPEYDSKRAVPGTTLPERSQINVEGLNVQFARNAIVLAPNGKVRVRAGIWPYKDTNNSRTTLGPDGLDEPGLLSQFSAGTQRFLFSSGTISLDASALLNVAGTPDVAVPLSHSILNVELRGSEFADSPVQRTGGLRGVPLTVDIRRSGVYGGRYWVGTPLGDVTGLAGLVERNAAQLTVAGGTIEMQAGRAIAMQGGATINVSGGFMQHEGGFVQTTRLRRGGYLVDIQNALPDQVYDGVYTGTFTESHPKWGVTHTYTVPWMTGRRYETGYIQGANGGTLTMTAPSMAIGGELLGLTVAGPRERSTQTELSRLSINFEAERTTPLTAPDLRVIRYSPTPPTVVLGRNTGEPGIDRITCSTELLASQGFGHLSINNPDGEIVVPENTLVAAPPKGSVTLSGSNVRIKGEVSAPGGELRFRAYNFSPSFAEEFNIQQAALQPDPVPNTNRGTVLVASGARLSTAGLIADDRLGVRGAQTKPVVLDGGAVAIEAFSADLEVGSVIDVSGGANMSGLGRVTYGKGGSIQITTGRDLSLNTVTGGTLKLGSRLMGSSGGTGGSLAIQTTLIQIGGVARYPGTLVLPASFFQQGGFTSYTLTGIGAPGVDTASAGGPIPYAPAINIAPGTIIEPRAESLVAVPHPAGSGQFALQPILKPQGLRSPASISLVATGVDDDFTLETLEARGDIVMGVGSRIQTDPGASISFRGDTVSLFGSLIAPGGTITIRGKDNFPVARNFESLLTSALPTVHIGAKSLISTAGVPVILPDAFGRRSGKVYDGGTISVYGNIVAQAGAILDVSGTTGIMDLHPAQLDAVTAPLVASNSGLNSPLWKLRTVPTRIDSNGGLIDLEGAQLLLTDATLLGGAGGPTAVGGTLSIQSGRFYPRSAGTITGNVRSTDINLVVGQSGNNIPVGSTVGIGRPILNGASSLGYFSIDRFNQGGFISLDLGAKFLESAPTSPIGFGGNVRFRGPIAINAPGTLRLAAGGVIEADSAVTLTAGRVAIGQPFRPPANPGDTVPVFQARAAGGSVTDLGFAPTFGTGSLTINGGLIDIGNLSLQTIGRAAFTSRSDIRGNGTLAIRGDLTLQAAQVYPTTLSTFNIFAYAQGAAGSVTIRGNGPANTPLSAGGNLNIFAPTIVQSGVLRAPLGSINLGWDGLDFDLSDADLDAPFDPVTRATLPAPVANTVRLTAGSVTSVSAWNRGSATALAIPFGLSPDGNSWIDPRGVNVTVTGLPEKRITISGNNVQTSAGSTVDIRGGGDLYGFRWTPGTGGSADLLGTASAAWNTGTVYQPGDLVTSGGQTWTARVRHSGQSPKSSLYWTPVAESYAVLPDYEAGFAPYAPFNTGANARLLGGDPGYVSTTLSIGDRIYLDGGSGLPAGSYTLLPRRYALLPGAFLVTPKATNPLGAITFPDGAVTTSGYRLNEFKVAGKQSPVRSQFEVASFDVDRSRAKYDDYSANAFITEAAKRLDVRSPQRLPIDSGYLSIQGNVGLQLNGQVATSRPATGRGAAIDLGSLANIHIVGGNGTAPVGATVVLNTATLNSWGAESLLIGGVRRRTAENTTLTVRTNEVTLNNPGDILSAPEIILASKSRLNVTPGSTLVSSGKLLEEADDLLVSGDGVLARVTSNLNGSLTRTNTTASTAPLLTVGAGARIAGPYVSLDSTYGTNLSTAADIEASALDLGSGQISIDLRPGGGALTGSVVPQHLVLAGQLLTDVQNVPSTTLRSYRTIDVYGNGTFGAGQGDLSLIGGGLRGYAQAGGTALFQVGSLTFGNPSNVAMLASPAASSGTLQFDSQTTRFGSNAFTIAGYQKVLVNAAGGALGDGSGSFNAAGNLTIGTPLITSTRSSKYTLKATGDLLLERTPGPAKITGGLGGSMTFSGSTVTANTRIALPSGEVIVLGTGNVTVGGELEAAGTAQKFFDVTRYTDGGRVVLTSSGGNVNVLNGATISVAGIGQGKAGTVAVNAAQGLFTSQGTLLGGAATEADSGTFLLDVNATGAYSALNNPLQAGGFFKERNFRIRTGPVLIDGLTRALDFTLSADAGPVNVTGTIDASGQTGGKIVIASGGSLSLQAGSTLTTHAAQFSSAGKGGTIRLEAGAAINGVANPAALLTIAGASGATPAAKIDLGVDAFVAGAYTDPNSSAFRGQFQGTLHLRAPRTATNIRMAALAGDIQNASSVLAEGFVVYDQTGGGLLDNGLRDTIHFDSDTYINAAYANIRTTLLGASPGTNPLDPALVIAPGVEIINRTGDLVLGTDFDDASNDWNLASFRYGPKGAAGVLTLRAAGNLEFKNALSDGFAGDFSPNDFGEVPQPGQELWLRPLMDINGNLPINTQSWSYRLTAGADFGASDFRRVRPLDTLGLNLGSVLVGKFYPSVLVFGTEATTAEAINNRFQVVRTGAGNIDIAAGRDVQLRNQFSTVYTAGVRLPYNNVVFAENDIRYMSIFAPNDFAVPLVEQSTSHPFQSTFLGVFQQAYAAQYAMAGGDVNIAAQADIGRYTQFNGQTVADSSRQLPNNWLYRRGVLDPATGLFGEGGVGFINDRAGSTTWWVDYSNFFQGFGALGGGDVSLLAGRNLVNADAATPTNARMAGRDDLTGLNLAPDNSRLLQLGGGDITLRAGNNIDGGVYYVERGKGMLTAGGAITTNSARSPSLGYLGSSFTAPASIVQSTNPSVYNTLTWLPTTLFAGAAQFTVSARGDVLLGPATNPFFLPQGNNNKFWYKSYFNTYSADSSVTVSSIGGSVTHRNAVTLPGSNSATSTLQAWLQRQNALSSENASFYEPWIRLAEADIGSFSVISSVGVSSLTSTAFAGNVNLVGDLNLFPSAQGNLQFFAKQGVVGLQPSGRILTRFGNSFVPVTAWTTGSVNLSDADPAGLPGITSPLGYRALVGNSESAMIQSLVNPFTNINPSFLETGSFSGTAGTAEVKRALHAAGPLHRNDAQPVRIYAAGGDITSLVLFAPKESRVVAENDIADVGLYIQNVDARSISLVAAGRDITPFNENTATRSIASDIARGNVVVGSPLPKTVTTVLGTSNTSLSGDIQISGPGVLEVIAGRNVDLGTGANLVDGTGSGIISIGNSRNPNLPLEGADLIVLAGVSGDGGSGPALGLSESSLDLSSFLKSSTSTSEIDSEYLKKLGSNVALKELSEEQQAIVALELFFRQLRETGRNYPTTGSYAPALSAVETVFGTSGASGEVLTRARDVRTTAGGGITIAASGGGLTMASDIFGNPLTPPGIVTEAGGAISIFTDKSVDIGQARIFTLRGGNILMWSTAGDIAAGTAPKTVVTAPPTRVLIDSTSADVVTDLGGLATGGGIGVLASVAGVMAGDVDLIAPSGVVDAGDAGIRSTGNLNIAATAVLNASNIQVSGSSSGVPTAAPVAAPNLGALGAANSAQGAQTASANDMAQRQQQQTSQEEPPSIITVEVLGYGGGSGEEQP